MRKEFKSYKVDKKGLMMIDAIRVSFDNLLNQLEDVLREDSREFSICKTKLEEACFFAVKSASCDPRYQYQEEKF
jgi:hypothetical protein